MGIIFCPKCKGKVSKARKDCFHCGYLLSEMKVCPDCGEDVIADALDCPECGYPFGEKDFEIKNGVLVKYKGEGRNIIIPNSVTSIGSFAFRSCDSLTSIEIPDSVERIGRGAFRNCTSLTSVTIGDSVTSIWNDAFYGCDSLTSITIGDGVTSIYSNAFNATAYYNNSANWENKVLYIGKYLIKAKETIEECKVKEGTLVIANLAFRNCRSLTSITIGDSVTSIGEGAFSCCKSLTSVTIGDSVTSIGFSAFSSCTSLTSIEIPYSVTSIGEGAFLSCRSLTSINFNGTKEQWDAITKGSFWKDNVPATYVTCSDGTVKL